MSQMTDIREWWASNAMTMPAWEDDKFTVTNLEHAFPLPEQGVAADLALCTSTLSYLSSCTYAFVRYLNENNTWLIESQSPVKDMVSRAIRCLKRMGQLENAETLYLFASHKLDTQGRDKSHLLHWKDAMGEYPAQVIARVSS
jgi:hypothetical protein